MNDEQSAQRTVTNWLPTFNRAIRAKAHHPEERPQDPRLWNEHGHPGNYERTDKNGMLLYQVTYKRKQSGANCMQTQTVDEAYL